MLWCRLGVKGYALQNVPPLQCMSSDVRVVPPTYNFGQLGHLTEDLRTIIEVVSLRQFAEGNRTLFTLTGKLSLKTGHQPQSSLPTYVNYKVIVQTLQNKDQRAAGCTSVATCVPKRRVSTRRRIVFFLGQNAVSASKPSFLLPSAPQV